MRHRTNSENTTLRCLAKQSIDAYGSQLAIAKKMVVCRFYRDPLRKVDFICLKTVTGSIF